MEVTLALLSDNSSTGGWFQILGGTHEKDCVYSCHLRNDPGTVTIPQHRFDNKIKQHTRLKIVSGLPYKIEIEGWNTHASSSSQEVLLWKDAGRGLKKKRERSQSVPLTLPASYSLFLPLPLFSTPRATSRSNERRRMDLRNSFWSLF